MLKIHHACVFKLKGVVEKITCTATTTEIDNFINLQDAFNVQNLIVTSAQVNLKFFDFC